MDDNFGESVESMGVIRGFLVSRRCVYALIRLEISCRTRWWFLKGVSVYLARDIPAFVMHCYYGESGSSLLIEFTDSMIIAVIIKFCA